VRPPKGACDASQGRISLAAERALLRLHRLTFYDPFGLVYGLPTYPWRMAPPGLLTRRQLRAKDLRPGGQPIVAQVIWWHGGRRTRNGRFCRERRIAYLYDESKALPVRPMTAAMWRSHARAMLARMTCPSCGVVQAYCISKYYGECNTCVDLHGCAA
jgi:hypothetical protein